MTVRELRAQLFQLPQDAEVVALHETKSDDFEMEEEPVQGVHLGERNNKAVVFISSVSPDDDNYEQ